MQLEEPPLEQVVCQLTFDSILAIRETPPAAFQNAVRERFPRFGEARRLGLVIAGDPRVVDHVDDLAWHFGAPDGTMTLALAPTSLSLAVARYESFIDTVAALQPALAALGDGFAPPSFTRIGLRYVNRLVMVREDDRPIAWSAWLHPGLAGVRLDAEPAGHTLETVHVARFATEHGELVLRYGVDVGETRGAASERLTLDLDHRTTRPIAFAAAERTLHDLHGVIGDVFRWCFTEAGLAMFVPR